MTAPAVVDDDPSSSPVAPRPSARGAATTVGRKAMAGSAAAGIVSDASSGREVATGHDAVIGLEDAP